MFATPGRRLSPRAADRGAGPARRRRSPAGRGRDHAPPTTRRSSATSVKIVLAEQETSGLAILTDGDVAHEDRLASLVEGLGGSSTDRGRSTLPDGAAVRAPRFDGAHEWRGPITRRRLAMGRRRRPTSSSSRSSSGRTRSPGWPSPAGAPGEVSPLALAEAMNAELRALAEAGCPIIQIDEGALTAIGDDAGEWRTLRRDAAPADRRASTTTT